jgi:N-formylglutamate deformylase
VQKLPVLITIPHGGMSIPNELTDKIIIGKKEIFEDIDPFTQEIYNLKDKVITLFKTDIARTFVDLSRAPDDLPPENSDGIIKSHTCFGKKIYKENEQPDSSLINQLLDKYYHSYHKHLRNYIEKNKKEIQLCLDCHTMAETGPAISPDKGMKRPLFCLGNRFGNAAHNDIIEKLKLSFVEIFNLDEKQVAINEPFAGGFITRNYGNNPLPWIQVEMNRSFYLAAPFFNSDNLTVNEKRLAELKDKFYQTLQNFFS